MVEAVEYVAEAVEHVVEEVYEEIEEVVEQVEEAAIGCVRAISPYIITHFYSNNKLNNVCLY